MPTINVGRVIRRDHDIDTASGLPGRNDDHRAIGQGDEKVAARCLANRSGINNDATRFADRWRGPDHKGGGNRSARCRRGDAIVSSGSSYLHGGGRCGKTKAFCREANRGINAAGRFFQHDETVAATCRTAARSGRPGSRGFKIGGRVSACSDRLLQFLDRRRCLGSGLAQVSTAVRRVCAPLGITTKVKQPAVCQLQRYRATRTGKDLFTCKKSIAFYEHTPDAFRGYRNNLADNTFDDGYNAAHWTLRVTRWGTSVPERHPQPPEQELCR